MSWPADTVARVTTPTGEQLERWAGSDPARLRTILPLLENEYESVSDTCEDYECQLLRIEEAADLFGEHAPPAHVDQLPTASRQWYERQKACLERLQRVEELLRSRTRPPAP